jgi:hypothetical protein
MPATAASAPATAMAATAASGSAAVPAASGMAATAAMPAESAMPESAMRSGVAMPVRKAVAPATMTLVAMVPSVVPAVDDESLVAVVVAVAVTSPSVADGLRRARGHGKAHADQ